MKENKIGIVVDEDFATKNVPPYPRPVFMSYESPLRVKAIFDYFNKIDLFSNKRIVKILTNRIDDSTLLLTHSTYHVDLIKRLSSYGSGILGEEIFITKDTFNLAKKAISGTIEAIRKVLNQEVSQSFALVRPPGHHAFRERASGLCIFNNIANAIMYFRTELNYDKKIAIVDIDDHFGDGLAQIFYGDASVLYFSIHEFDFEEGDMGFIDELGEGEGLGKNINFPVPAGMTDDDFLEFFDVLEPVLKEFRPDIIIVAAGFDMYFDDAIGNCLLTSASYYNFTKYIVNIAEEICEGKLVFVLEGGYSLIGLPVCVHAVLKALLKESHERHPFEEIYFSKDSKKTDIIKIKLALKKLLANYWTSLG